jgi:hypothetical protein
LLTGVSWLDVAERVGALVELAAMGGWRALATWRDRRLGARAAAERDAVVADEVGERPRVPVRIMTPEEPPEVSERVDKEKQRPLFTDVPGDGLPPLALLDEASAAIEGPSVETLEFTSRLIEHKLREFGVDVQVLAAYPGPVITRYEIQPATGVKGSQIVNLVKDLDFRLIYPFSMVVKPVLICSDPNWILKEQTWLLREISFSLNKIYTLHIIVQLVHIKLLWQGKNLFKPQRGHLNWHQNDMNWV